MQCVKVKAKLNQIDIGNWFAYKYLILLTTLERHKKGPAVPTSLENQMINSKTDLNTFANIKLSIKVHKVLHFTIRKIANL